MILNNRWKSLAAIGFVAVAGMAHAAKAENSLLGIKLFDSGVRVVTVYGSPDEIQAINISGFGNSGGGGMGAGRGPGMGPGMGGPAMGGGGGGMGPSLPPGGGGPGGAGAASMTPGDISPGDMSFGDYVLRQMSPGGQGGKMPGRPGGMSGPPPGMGGPPPGFGGAPSMPGGPGGMGGRPGAGGVPGGGGGSATNATFTRWVYNRSGCKYGFIIDNKGRVVQIEAIGLTNPKVRTSQGITFGNTFAQVIKKYQTPDGYDISGDNIMARFLNRSKVAFRFSRVADNKPQVVTGIVVAAGKG